MFRSSSNFDKLIDKATSNLLLEPDWDTTLTICDYIRQGDVQSKYAINAIKKKLYASNPHVNLYALQILESCVKNCGTPFHTEVASKQFMDELRDLVKVTTNEQVREKILELIQTWAHAFRNEPSYRPIQDTLNFMKQDGHRFPILKETDAMFLADSAPKWIEGDFCHRCRVQFSVIHRKHHCRNCGQIFCAKCSSKQSIIPKFGIEKQVRVCEDCFEKLNKPIDNKTSKLSSIPNQSSPMKSAENLKSNATPTKSDQELQEEEDLQMAIALSKSEAESKEKNKSHYSDQVLSHSPINNASKKTDKIKCTDPELEKYLNRSFWEQKLAMNSEGRISPAPSAPLQHYTVKSALQNSDDKSLNSTKIENGEKGDIDTFLASLKSALEIFVNRMNSNQLRGRPIANDSAVQSLFLNITNMHSQLLKHIQEQDDARAHFESLQDKLSQIRDARAALDALREEHQEKLRMEAEENERLRQQQMAQKLIIMRKKKQEYLQYQRQMALQRIQEQEREMLLRKEQQKYSMWQQQQQPQPQPPSASRPQGPRPAYPGTHIPYNPAAPPVSAYGPPMHMTQPVSDLINQNVSNEMNLSHSAPNSPANRPTNYSSGPQSLPGNQTLPPHPTPMYNQPVGHPAEYVSYAIPRPVTPLGPERMTITSGSTAVTMTIDTRTSANPMLNQTTQHTVPLPPESHLIGAQMANQPYVHQPPPQQQIQQQQQEIESNVKEEALISFD